MDRDHHPSREHGLRGITAGDGDGHQAYVRGRFGFYHDWRLIMAVDFTKLPVGTKVETVCGPGVIAEILIGDEYPIRVRCDGYIYETYTADGRCLVSESRPTLFLAPFEWPEQEQPLPDLAVDAPVMVRAHDGDSWKRRHFCRWEGGKCATFYDGWTSFAPFPPSTLWEQWRLPTETELKGTDNVE